MVKGDIQHSKTPGKEDLVSGVASGLFTGIILGAISVPVNYFLLLYFSPGIQRFLPGYEPTVSGTVEISMGTALLMVLVGLIYGILHDYVPGRTDFFRVLIFGIIIFAGTTLIDYVTDYHFSPGLFYAESLFDVPAILLMFTYLMSKSFSRLRMWSSRVFSGSNQKMEA